MGALVNKTHTLAAAVADGATFTTAYPAGYVQADLDGTTGGQLVVNGDVWNQDADPGVGFTFGLTDITVTNNTNVAFAAGADVTLSFARTDINGSYNLTAPRQTQDKVDAL